MNKEAAGTLVEAWNATPAGSQSPGDDYQRLERALRQLLPDDIEAAGVTLVGDVPTVVALNQTSVFAAHLDAEGQRGGVVVRRLPLAPDRITVSMTDNPRGATPKGKDAHVRAWSFAWMDADALSFESVVKAYGAWGEETWDYGEMFARTLAERVGWVLPGTGGSPG